MLMPGQVLQNRYRIDAALGRGGMGAVYRAYDTRLQHVCVIKELLIQPGMTQRIDEAAAQFWDEARALASLNHPNLPRVTDYFEENGFYFLTMDFVTGERLTNLIESGLTEDTILGYADKLLDVLEYIHQNGVLHRDIKPDNIIIEPNGMPVLVDFGLVKTGQAGGGHTRTIVHGAGTPEYAPPEQYTGGTDQRSDIFSLGATLYHALTGQAPASVTDQMAGIPLRPLRQIKGTVSPETERIVLKAINQVREQRYPTAAAMHAELRRATRVLSSQQPALAATRVLPPTGIPPSPLQPLQAAPPVVQVSPTSRAQKRSHWSLIAGGIMLILIAGTVVLLVIRQANDGGTISPTRAADVTAMPGKQLPTAASATQTTDATSKVASSTAGNPATTTAAPSSTSAPTSSPQAGTPARLVFARGLPDCSAVILRNLDTNAEITISHGDDNADPSWSPDGLSVVVASGSCNATDHGIVILAVDGSGARRIVDGGNNIDPFWGSDGRIYFARGPKSGGDLYEVDPNGSRLTALGLNGRQPALSPDGQRLVFMKLDGGAWRIWLAQRSDSGFSNAIKLPLPAVANGNHARMPNWTCDSQYVVFNITDNSFNSVALGSVNVSNNQAQATALQSSSGFLARPGCSRTSDLCVVNGSDHGLFSIRFTDGVFANPLQISDLQDWGGDVYP